MKDHKQVLPPANAGVTPLPPLPLVATVKKLPEYFAAAELTPSKIRAQIFDASDRFDSQGRRIQGNGLSGAIIRRAGSRTVLVDVVKYGQWLAGRGVV